MGSGRGNEGMWFRRCLPIALRILMRHKCVSRRGHSEKRQNKGRSYSAAATEESYYNFVFHVITQCILFTLFTFFFASHVVIHVSSLVLKSQLNDEKIAFLQTTPASMPSGDSGTCHSRKNMLLIPLLMSLPVMTVRQHPLYRVLCLKSLTLCNRLSVVYSIESCKLTFTTLMNHCSFADVKLHNDSFHTHKKLLCFDKINIAMARPLCQNISKTAGLWVVPSMLRSLPTKSGPRKNNQRTSDRAKAR